MGDHLRRICGKWEYLNVWKPTEPDSQELQNQDIELESDEDDAWLI